MNKLRNFVCVEKRLPHQQNPAHRAKESSTRLFVIGKRDMEANAVSVRVHGKGNLGAKPLAEVIADTLLSINERQS